MNTKINYYKMLLSIIINNFGDVLFDLFIVWQITNKTSNIMNAVYMIGSSILFRAILSIFIGVIVDKFNKKKIIIFSNISSICIIMILALIFGNIQNNVLLSIIFILFNDINNEMFGRSTLLLASELFDKKEFIKFQAKYTVINRIIVIAATSIVGFMIAVIPNIIIFIVDIITFIVSILLICSINYDYVKNFSFKSIEDIFIDLKEDISYVIKEIKTNRYILTFICIMFILNMGYGYIPYVLPIKIANDNMSPVILGFIKSAITIGEIIGLLLVTIFGTRVSLLFKISMMGNAIIMGGLYYVKSIIIIVVFFILYGVLDSMTQPLFSYTVSMIDEKNRGKIIGGIDALILLSPSIGIYIISKLMNYNNLYGYMLLIIIFTISYFIVQLNKKFNFIKL